ncbi:hypothetical protein [Natronobacterium texcoconense]|nr:hypothetical protein [Natronobacterium texcoconense]
MAVFDIPPNDHSIGEWLFPLEGGTGLWGVVESTPKASQSVLA